MKKKWAVLIVVGSLFVVVGVPLAAIMVAATSRHNWVASKTWTQTGDNVAVTVNGLHGNMDIGSFPVNTNQTVVMQFTVKSVSGPFSLEVQDSHGNLLQSEVLTPKNDGATTQWTFHPAAPGEYSVELWGDQSDVNLSVEAPGISKPH